MGGALSLLVSDIVAIWRSIAVWELTRYALYALFVVILALPLKKVDRRDTWTAVTYMMVICLYAVLFLVAIPVLEDGADTATRSVMVICVAAGAAAVRWFIGYEEVEVVIVEAVNKEAGNGKSHSSEDRKSKAA